jgi:UDP-2,3-diacylglucosamine pyrophosphatase LpxH
VHEQDYQSVALIVFGWQLRTVVSMFQVFSLATRDLMMMVLQCMAFAKQMRLCSGES